MPVDSASEAPSEPLSIGVLASHEGTTLQAVLDACGAGAIRGRVALVVSNNSACGALRRARAAGARAVHLSSVTHPEPADLDHSADELAARLLQEAVPPGIQSALDELRNGLERGSEGLGDAATALDPTLVGAVESFGRQAGDLLGDLEKKIHASLRKENEVALAQVEKARTNLFPLGKPQERILNPFQYLVRYGRPFLEAAEAASSAAVLPRIEPEA